MRRAATLLAFAILAAHVIGESIDAVIADQYELCLSDLQALEDACRE